MFRYAPATRRALKLFGYAAALLLVPTLAGLANLRPKAPDTRPEPAPAFDARLLPAPPTPDPTRKIAVVLASAQGAELTDFVAPYEVLGQSGAFEVYALAPERKPLPLVNANMAATTLDFVPHFSFDEYDRLVGRPPDVIAIPWVPGHTPERDAEMLAWIRANASPGTTLLTICAGTQILAETGLLEGRTATTNVGWFEQLEAGFPGTTWVRGVRYHDDGRIITSTNVASGIDASLHAVDRLVGRAAAEDVARRIGYRRTAYLEDPRYDAPSPRQWLLTMMAPVAANAAFQWGQEHVGVLLYDGVSELALGGLVDPYTASLVARTHALAPDRAVVRSRNGLALIPRHDADSAPRLDRVVLPGGAATAAERAVAAWAGRRPEPPVERIHGRVGAGESAHDATLRDMAARHNRMVAAAVGRALFYAADERVFDGATPAVVPVVVPAALGLLGLGLARLVGRAIGRARLPRPQPA